MDKEEEEKAHDAAEEAVSSDRLLPGEDPTSALADDAAHWVAVYTELLDFKREILGGTAKHMGGMREGDARQEVENTDEVVLQAESDRLSRRLAFWRARLADLG